MEKSSKRKEVIHRILRETTYHPTAEQVYEQARKELPGISLETVSRIIGELKQEGKLSDLERIGLPARFDARTEPHYHFVCEQCGRIFDVNEHVNKKLDKEIARKTGFKVSHHRGVFYGLCKDCQPRSS